MLRVTVEIFPHGDSLHRRTLATMDVWNTGEGTHREGYYGFAIYNEAGRLEHSGYIQAFKRASYTVMWLIAGILRFVYPDFRAWVAESPSVAPLDEHGRETAKRAHTK